jgi:hypothetical protein
MKPLLGGIVHSGDLDGWKISWESDGWYRHWCLMTEREDARQVLLVLQNPGSLSGGGERLAADDTLRVLREVFRKTGFSPFIVNLYDYADPDGSALADNWARRDKVSSPLIYDRLVLDDFAGKLFAYGDIETALKPKAAAVRERIKEITERLAAMPAIEPIRNRNGTPKHPRRWKIDEQIEEMRSRIHRL